MAAVDKLRERLMVELTAPLLALGLDVEAVDVSPAGRRRVVRVAVDQDDGVTLDEVATATKEISRVLDSSDVMGEQPYTLEVTSPGVDRPLTLPRHWRRNRSRLVQVSMADGTKVTGRIGDSDDRSVTLDVDGAPQQVDLADVALARIQVEFNRKES